MKIIRTLFLLLIAVYGGSVSARPMLKATFGSTTLYYGIGPSYADRAVILNSTVTTPDGVYYGSEILRNGKKRLLRPYSLDRA